MKILSFASAWWLISISLLQVVAGRGGHEVDKPAYALINSKTSWPDQSETDEVDEDIARYQNKEFDVDKDEETVTEIVQAADNETTSSSLPTINTFIQLPTKNRSISNQNSPSKQKISRQNASSNNSTPKGYNLNDNLKQDFAEHFFASGVTNLLQNNTTEKQNIETKTKNSFKSKTSESNIFPTSTAFDNTSLLQTPASMVDKTLLGTQKVYKKGKQKVAAAQPKKHKAVTLVKVSPSSFNDWASNFPASEIARVQSTATSRKPVRLINNDFIAKLDKKLRGIRVTKHLGQKRFNNATVKEIPLGLQSGIPSSSRKDNKAAMKNSYASTTTATVQNIDNSSTHNNDFPASEAALALKQKAAGRLPQDLHQDSSSNALRHPGDQLHVTTKPGMFPIPSNMDATTAGTNINNTGSAIADKAQPPKPKPPSSYRRASIVRQKTFKTSPPLLPATPQPTKLLRAGPKHAAAKQASQPMETAEDILSWESWSACTRTCGSRAFRSRQRKCGKLLKEDFDVACPEPVVQTQKCPTMPCSGHLSKEKLAKFLNMNDETTVTKATTTTHETPEDDQNMIDQIFGKTRDHSPVFLGSSAAPLSTEESKSAADQDNTGSVYQDEVDENDSADNTGQRRYLYSIWSSWSACTRTCGQRTYTFRKRYCIDVSTGDLKRHCQKPTILVKKCDITPCPINGGLSSWSLWSSCSGHCGVMERHRSCTNPRPAYGGSDCNTLPVQVRMCGTCEDEQIAAAQKSVAYSPKTQCGSDPCQRIGCLEDKNAICVTDFQCNPTFFGEHGRVLESCKDKTNLYLRPMAQKQCLFNPCKFAKCDQPETKCLVDTNCRPFFVDDQNGKKMKCKGSNILHVSSELVCGFNPCTVTTCTVDPDARCVTDYRCNPLFINSKGKIIPGCTDDELTEVEKMDARSSPRAAKATENPTTRDQTTPAPYNDHQTEHSDFIFAKKNLNRTKQKLDMIKKLEKLLGKRLHHDTATLDKKKHRTSKNKRIDLLDNVLKYRLQHHNSLTRPVTTKGHDKMQRKKGIELLKKFLKKHLERKLDVLSRRKGFSNNSRDNKIELLEKFLKKRLEQNVETLFKKKDLGKNAKISRNKGVALLEKFLQQRLKHHTMYNKSSDNSEHVPEELRDAFTRPLPTGETSTNSVSPEKRIMVKTINKTESQTTEVVNDLVDNDKSVSMVEKLENPLSSLEDNFHNKKIPEASSTLTEMFNSDDNDNDDDEEEEDNSAMDSEHHTSNFASKNSKSSKDKETGINSIHNSFDRKIDSKMKQKLYELEKSFNRKFHRGSNLVDHGLPKKDFTNTTTTTTTNLDELRKSNNKVDGGFSFGHSLSKENITNTTVAKKLNHEFEKSYNHKFYGRLSLVDSGLSTKNITRMARPGKTNVTTTGAIGTTTTNGNHDKNITSSGSTIHRSKSNSTAPDTTMTTTIGDGEDTSMTATQPITTTINERHNTTSTHHLFKNNTRAPVATTTGNGKGTSRNTTKPITTTINESHKTTSTHHHPIMNHKTDLVTAIMTTTIDDDTGTITETTNSDTTTTTGNKDNKEASTITMTKQDDTTENDMANSSHRHATSPNLDSNSLNHITGNSQIGSEMNYTIMTDHKPSKTNVGRFGTSNSKSTNTVNNASNTTNATTNTNSDDGDANSSVTSNIDSNTVTTNPISIHARKTTSGTNTNSAGNTTSSITNTNTNSDSGVNINNSDGNTVTTNHTSTHTSNNTNAITNANTNSDSINTNPSSAHTSKTTSNSDTNSHSGTTSPITNLDTNSDSVIKNPTSTHTSKTTSTNSESDTTNSNRVAISDASNHTTNSISTTNNTNKNIGTTNRTATHPSTTKTTFKHITSNVTTTTKPIINNNSTTANNFTSTTKPTTTISSDTNSKGITNDTTTTNNPSTSTTKPTINNTTKPTITNTTKPTITNTNPTAYPFTTTNPNLTTVDTITTSTTPSPNTNYHTTTSNPYTNLIPHGTTNTITNPSTTTNPTTVDTTTITPATTPSLPTHYLTTNPYTTLTPHFDTTNTLSNTNPTIVDTTTTPSPTIYYRTTTSNPYTTRSTPTHSTTNTNLLHLAPNSTLTTNNVENPDGNYTIYVEEPENYAGNSFIDENGPTNSTSVFPNDLETPVLDDQQLSDTTILHSLNTKLGDNTNIINQLPASTILSYHRKLSPKYSDESNESSSSLVSHHQRKSKPMYNDESKNVEANEERMSFPEGEDSILNLPQWSENPHLEENALNDTDGSKSLEPSYEQPLMIEGKAKTDVYPWENYDEVIATGNDEMVRRKSDKPSVFYDQDFNETQVYKPSAELAASDDALVSGEVGKQSEFYDLDGDFNETKTDQSEEESVSDDQFGGKVGGQSRFYDLDEDFNETRTDQSEEESVTGNQSEDESVLGNQSEDESVLGNQSEDESVSSDYVGRKIGKQSRFYDLDTDFNETKTDKSEDEAVSDDLFANKVGKQSEFHDLDTDFNETKSNQSRDESMSGDLADEVLANQRPSQPGQVAQPTNFTINGNGLNFIKEELSKAIEKELENFKMAGIVGEKSSSAPRNESSREDSIGSDGVNGNDADHHEGSHHEPVVHHESDKDGIGLNEINDFLKDQDSKIGDFEKEAKTADKNEGTLQTGGNYKISQDPNENDDSGVDEGEEGIGSEVDEQSEISKDPEYKDSYSSALKDEIKDLGLSEYYIKDGFEGSKDKMIEDDGELRHALSKVDRDSPESHHVDSDLLKVRTSPEGQASLRKHDSEGDAIERVESNPSPTHEATQRSDAERTGDEISDSNDDVIKGIGALQAGESRGHAGSLGGYLDDLRKYVGDIDKGMFSSSEALEGKDMDNDDDEGVTRDLDQGKGVDNEDDVGITRDFDRRKGVDNEGDRGIDSDFDQGKVVDDEGDEGIIKDLDGGKDVDSDGDVGVTRSLDQREGVDNEGDREIASDVDQGRVVDNEVDGGITSDLGQGKVVDNEGDRGITEGKDVDNKDDEGIIRDLERNDVDNEGKTNLKDALVLDAKDDTTNEEISDHSNDDENLAGIHEELGSRKDHVTRTSEKAGKLLGYLKNVITLRATEDRQDKKDMIRKTSGKS